MTKQELFLWGVQTVILSNNSNVIRNDNEGQKSHIYSATGVYGTVQDAIYASGRIPESMSAEEAVHDFCFYMLENLREEKKCPNWFARY
ncbi:hypothetical protein RI049_07040 [Cedecea neteri]|uniref:hypothetical protein n=1 Tax=Cedecea neteri TaxID=158822 RepID=UPI002AA77084|nr:hypothetical protein [Cedecea neteri]WPU24500.1 hypothetical protein RI049_07040 [Cedecea neteri]